MTSLTNKDVQQDMKSKRKFCKQYFLDILRIFNDQSIFCCTTSETKHDY